MFLALKSVFFCHKIHTNYTFMFSSVFFSSQFERYINYYFFVSKKVLHNFCYIFDTAARIFWEKNFKGFIVTIGPTSKSSIVGLIEVAIAVSTSPLSRHACPLSSCKWSLYDPIVQVESTCRESI